MANFTQTLALMTSFEKYFELRKYKVNITVALVVFIALSLNGITYSQNQKRIIKDAYKLKSDSLLSLFFTNWHKEYEPVADSTVIKMGTVSQSTYRIFKLLYSETRFETLDFKRESKIYNNTEYIVVQDHIRVFETDISYYNEEQVDEYVCSMIERTVKLEKRKKQYLQRTDGKLHPKILAEYSPNKSFIYHRKLPKTPFLKIKNFRPQVSISSKKSIYLSKKYENILKSQLKKYNRHHYRIAEPRSPKANFLDDYIRFTSHHWDKGWHLISFPTFYSITFDCEQNYARVDYRIGYGGGSAVLKQSNGVWELIGANSTWSE